MRFSKIHIPSKLTTEKGIKEINIRTSKLVAFIGKNGAGKSRILDLIERNLINTINMADLSKDILSIAPTGLVGFQKAAKEFSNFYQTQRSIIETNKIINDNPKDTDRTVELTELNKQMHNLEKAYNAKINSIKTYPGRLSNLLPSVHSKFVRRIKTDDVVKLKLAIENVGKEKGTLPFEKLIENFSDEMEYDEIGSINSSALNYLAKIPHILTHDRFDSLVKEKMFEETKSFKLYLSLKSYISKFLKKDLTYESNIGDFKLTETGSNVTYSGKWRLNGRDFDYTELSDGEKTLFAYALLFFLLAEQPNLRIRESIIIIDEPELHLHPDSEIDLIEGLTSVIEDKGQLIIATHSINILSTLNYNEIFMVKDGIINSPCRTNPKNSLLELINVENRIHKLTDFLSSLQTWTYVNFMADCFNHPEAISSSGPKDPQIEAFKEAIQHGKEHDGEVLLDFGAGKGRLFKQASENGVLPKGLLYCALEPKAEYHTELKEIGIKKIYKSHLDLEPDTFAFIVVCNVLHEIPLSSWVPCINSIISALKPEGRLIIIEPKILSKGEKIDDTGFLVLGIKEIQKLFSLNKPPSTIRIGKDDNTICAVLSEEQLKKISINELIESLIELEKNTFTSLTELRHKEYKNEEHYTIGRAAAFYSQQNINARIALALLAKPTNE